MGELLQARTYIKPSTAVSSTVHVPGRLDKRACRSRARREGRQHASGCDKQKGEKLQGGGYQGKKFKY